MPKSLAATLNLATILIASAALAKLSRVERSLNHFIENELEMRRMSSHEHAAIFDQVQLAVLGKIMPKARPSSLSTYQGSPPEKSK